MEPGHPRRHRQGGLTPCLVLIALCFSGTCAWAAGPKFLFDIPAGDAQKTLQDYYSQSKIEMLYLTDTVRGTTTNAVAGNLEASEALEQMLKGTSLEFSFDEDFSFVSINPRVQLAGVAEHVEVAAASTRAESHDQTEAMRYLFGDQKLEQVVVTGTLIRGVLDIMSPLEFVTKREMKKTGYATVQDALQTLPVSFGGGPSEDFTGTGNFARGVAANLRGLGAGATLVLVNGQRQPYSGTDGDFVDVSNIPWSAVDRIEVLPDGASALYGSDAIAGVVNVIMRNDFDGAETQARLGSAIGGADEKLISQLFGTKWNSGNALISYQYFERSSLGAASRSYAANADKTSFGGTDHRSYLSNPGNILDPRSLVPAFGIPAGQDGTGLTATDLLAGSINLQNKNADVDLVPDRRMHSLFFGSSQKLGERMELFAEGRFGHRDMKQQYFPFDKLLFVPSTNPFFVNPYPAVPFAIVGYSFLDDLGPVDIAATVRSVSGAFGYKADVSDTWRLKLAGSYGRESVEYVGNNMINPTALTTALADTNPETAFNPFGDGRATNPGTLDAIRFAQREHARSSVRTVNLTADGSVVDTARGPIRLAVGGEWRREDLKRGVTKASRFGRSIESAFAELSVPLIGQASDSRAVPRLELSLAGRYERYSDFGTTSNPKIGLRWVPLESLKFRTSWGTSFKAPKLVDIYDSSRNAASLVSLRDPRSSTGTSVVLAREGNNPELTEETATTWTAGIDFAPRQLRGLTLSLTYYSIDYDQRIVVPGPPSPFDVLQQEDVWADIITRTPLQSSIDSICSSAEYRGSVAQCKSAPIAAIVDLRVRNLAATHVRGFDVKLDHSLDTRFGNFGFGLNGGYVLGFEQAVLETAPSRNVVNTVGNPPALRLRASADWYQRDWDLPGFGANMTIGHDGAYDDTESSVRHHVRLVHHARSRDWLSHGKRRWLVERS